MEIAVIGSGIAGMSAAYALSLAGHCVSVFEAHPGPGMDSQSITYRSGDVHCRIDVPLRSFSPHYYPNLVALYQHLGLDITQVDYCQSVGVLGGSTYFRYSNLLFGGRYALPFVQLWKLFTWRYYRTVRDIVRFVACMRGLLLRPQPPGAAASPGGAVPPSLDEYMRSKNFSHEFYEGFLLPICSTILSCNFEDVRNYPVDIIARFFAAGSTTLQTGWLRVRSGVQDVAKSLLAPVRHVYFNNAIRWVEPNGDGTVAVEDATGTRRVYQHVILATEANVALKLLRDPTPAEKKVLSSVQYRYSRAVVHTDTSLMPKNPRDWATMNTFVTPQGLVPDTAAMTTVWMNRVQPLGATPLFETWNPLCDPDPATVIHEATFVRAVINVPGGENLRGIDDIQGTRGVWFCGSYASRGMTLLENAVCSSMWVAKQLGADCPWTAKPAQDRPRWSGVGSVAFFLLPAAVVVAAAKARG